MTAMKAERPKAQRPEKQVMTRRAAVLCLVLSAALVLGLCGVVPASAAPEMSTIQETDILQTIDRKPLEMSVSAVASRGAEIALATTRGLLVVNSNWKTAKRLIAEPVTQVVWDAANLRWVAGGSMGAWREDVGWFHPGGLASLGLEASAIESIVESPSGLLFSTGTQLWLVNGDRSVPLLTDTDGLMGRPAATHDEAAVLGFWSLHRVGLERVWDTSTRGSRRRTDIPLPAELRADIPLGVAYVGRSLIVVGRRSGLYILSPSDLVFPEAIRPPVTDDAHLEAGFPDGWSEFDVDGDELYLLHADASLHHISIGRSLRRISEWPALDQPYRFAWLPGRRVLLFPFAGNFVLNADPTRSEIPKKYNFMSTSTREILLRPGLSPGRFAHTSSMDLIRMGVAWGILLILLVVLVLWSAVNGIPLVFYFHPMAASFAERLAKYRRDSASYVQSYRRIEKELQRMSAVMVSHAHAGAPDDIRQYDEDRIRYLQESLVSLKENMRQFIRNVTEESSRVRMDTHPRTSSAPMGRRERFLWRQTRGWQRLYLDVVRGIEEIIAEESAPGASK